MNQCPFNPEAAELKADELIKCPDCGHFVLTGYPHPDFSSKELPVAEDELIRLATKTN